MVQPLWKTVWQFFKRSDVELLEDLAILLLDTFLEIWKTYTLIKMCTQMPIPALFIIAERWRQPKCPSTDEQTNRMWSTYTMKYYLAIKSVDTYYKMDKGLQNVMLNESSPKRPWFRLHAMFGIDKSIETESRSWLPRTGGTEGGEGWLTGTRFLSEVMKMC